MGGLAVGVEVYKARHIAVLFIGLGNPERSRVGFTSSLLPAACSPSSATLSAFASSCKSHGDHVGRFLFFWVGFPLYCCSSELGLELPLPAKSHEHHRR